eukprot:CAMPEP_0185763226 /NCGR_PEP_ID=MMETSP1174-20130828/22176_1 /TAXON_ID=35687 /ORGANISM="Dictyocha speculum, Strain CCMP1381" /LENGTH=45 /DNA_ID= /DNA_START= /DNA_END= /DNA_ORIENTATION=
MIISERSKPPLEPAKTNSSQRNLDNGRAFPVDVFITRVSSATNRG